MILTCLRCDCWRPIDAETGTCRKLSPRRIVADVFHATDAVDRTTRFKRGDLHTFAVWPVTSHDDGCSEAEQRHTSHAPPLTPPSTIRLPHVKTAEEKIEAIKKSCGIVPQFNPSLRAPRGSIADKIYKYLRNLGRPAGWMEIVTAIGGNKHSVRTTLGTLHKRGVLLHEGLKYSLKPEE